MRRLSAGAGRSADHDPAEPVELDRDGPGARVVQAVVPEPVVVVAERAVQLDVVALFADPPPDGDRLRAVAETRQVRASEALAVARVGSDAVAVHRELPAADQHTLAVGGPRVEEVGRRQRVPWPR